MTATRSRLRLAVAAGLAATLVVALVLALAGMGSGDGGKLAWEGKVQLFDTAIPTDKVLYSKIENASLRDVDLDVEAVRTYDAEGREVESATVFLAAFAHGIFPYDYKVSDFERRRLGKIATLRPGQSVPVTLAWRVRKGEEPPVRVDFGPAELELPR